MIKNALLNFKLYFSKGHERTILAKKNIALSFLLKAANVSIGFVLIPTTINYVNQTQYGIWLTLTSIISWFSFFDIGLGNGLKNKLAENNALGKYEDSRVYVSTTYAVLTLTSLTLFLVFFIFNFFIDWKRILNVQQLPREYLSKLALLVFGFFCLQFVSQIINTVLVACHAIFKSSLVLVIGQFISLIVIFILTRLTKGSLINLVSVLSGIPIMVMILSSFWFFNRDYKRFSPSLKLVNFKYAKSLLSVGGIFFLVQLGGLILFQTDNIVISQLFGPKYVTIFNLVFKLFSIISMVFTIILAPFWSAFTDAYYKNDIIWIKQVFKKMYFYWTVLAISTFLLLLISPYLLTLWVGKNIHAPFMLSVSMAFYVIGFCWMLIHCSLLNGIGKIKLQLYLYIVCAIINIPVAILLGKVYGMAGVTASNVIIMIMMGIVLYFQCYKILNNSAYGIWNT